MSKSKYVGSFIDGVYQVAGGSAKSATRTQPAVQVAAAGGKGGYVHSPPPAVNPRYAKEDMRSPARRVQVVIPDEQVTAGPNPGTIGGMGSNPIVPFNVSNQPPGTFPLAKYEPPPQEKMLPAVIPRDPNQGGRAQRGVHDRGGQQTYHVRNHQTYDEAYQPYIDMGGEIGEMATQAAKGRTPIEEFLNTPYGGRQVEETVEGPMNLHRTGPMTIMEMITGNSKVKAAPDFTVTNTRPSTIGDAVTDAGGPQQKSNGPINKVPSEKTSAETVTPGDGGYAGFSGAFERHAVGAGLGIGATYMSEGEVTASGTIQGGIYGMIGGKAARMLTGSMRGGAVNSMARGVGDTLGAAEKGTFRKTAGDYISGAMSGFDGAKSQEAMRMATFAGAGLAGFSMGRDRNHSRGMNSSRGSRF